MRGLLFTAATVTALAALASRETAPPDLPGAIGKSAAADRVYVLHASDVSCTVRQGLPSADGTSPVFLDSACGEAMPALAGAVQWRDLADGSVLFANSAGDALVEFAPADGAGFETFRPGVPLASIREVE